MGETEAAMSHIDCSYPEDSRYPPFLYTTKAQDDAIDFPCSPAWLNYYHAVGLTPRRVEQQQAAQTDLQNELESLRTQYFSIKEELFRLKHDAKPANTTATRPAFRGIP